MQFTRSRLQSGRLHSSMKKRIRTTLERESKCRLVLQREEGKLLIYSDGVPDTEDPLHVLKVTVPTPCVVLRSHTSCS